MCGREGCRNGEMATTATDRVLESDGSGDIESSQDALDRFQMPENQKNPRRILGVGKTRESVEEDRFLLWSFFAPVVVGVGGGRKKAQKIFGWWKAVFLC